jgi:tight adherence protein B
VVGVILGGSLLVCLLLLLGVRDLVTVSATRRDVAAAVIGMEDFDRLPFADRWDRVLRRTRIGQRLERELVLAGIDRRPVVVLVAGLGVGIAVGVVLWQMLAPFFGILGVGTGLLAVRGYLSRGRTRRREAFIAQMPELARVLANATNAGLSIATAIAIAGDELDEPAKTEMQRASTSLTFGNDLQSALDGIRERVGSREVSVLVSTLIVSARSGGSLVTALRDIADTLERRKETRREIRTILAQSLATGYLVIGMGLGLLFLLNAVQPGTVDAMLGSIVGQLALAVSALLFVGGFLVIRRMTRIEP